MKRRTRLLWCVVGTLAAAPLAAVLAWVVVNSRDIAATDVSDLLPETAAVSHGDNAHRALSEAVARLQWANDSHSESFPEEWDDALIGNLLSRNGEVLTLLEQAFACPAYHADEGSGPDSWFRLSLFVVQKAAYERRIGLRDLACESSCGLLRLGTWITSCPRSLAEWAQGVMALRLGLDGIERLLCDARWSEAELVTLLDRLNQADVSDRGLAQAFKMEFQQINEAIEGRPLTRTNRSLLGVYRFQPNRTRETFARFHRRAIGNIPRLPGDVRLPHVAPLRMGRIQEGLFRLRPNRQGRVLIDVVLSRQGSLDRCFEDKWGIRAHLEGLRLVVACRLYEIRHGRLPETLDVLVPELLAETPRDPYDGKPFRYVRERAFVYSVGEDLKDSQGSGPPSADSASIRRNVESSDEPNWPEPLPPRPMLLLGPTGGADDLVFSLRPGTE
jgi:hypothetical protein